MSKIITVTIAGKGPETDAPSIGDLLDQLRDYFELLNVLEQTLAEDGQSAIIWRIVDAKRSSPLTFTIQAFARQFAVNVDARAGHVVDRAFAGLRLLEEQAERPAYFTEKALERAERIFERVTNGLDQTEIRSDGFRPIVLTPSVARVASRNTRSVLEPGGRPFKEIGSVEGYIQTVGRDGRGRRVVWIKHRLTGDEVRCALTGDAAKALAHCEVEDVWRGDRVSLFGTIHYRTPGRISHIEASAIRFLRSRSELPDVDDIIDPDFTGGLKSEEYLEKLRNGELS
ncbi:MAG: hypothetical protein J0I57_23355 [Hyphomicrobium sp.]|mgnify:CR=1 FL=1|nr:hypothetical protein [Hyphomicrobium sp.]MBN9265265.1 hypothetical protein [Hyphomicrobium sp.]MBN9280541.1 hypothetical protein [Hyphomicrobium sp.]ODT29700.1 MAG: hypothetical protein ABS54_04345 [Hyphomicrobium sp. SCN 65-11]OJU19345.1 MAG: hypothetical protein BGN89_04265 [Alphaproteobacteria bacterium 64-6]